MSHPNPGSNRLIEQNDVLASGVLDPDSDVSANMPKNIYIILWRNGSSSFMFFPKSSMFNALDRIGEPSDAIVRVVPSELMCEVTFDQDIAGDNFKISMDTTSLWEKCTVQVWPLESLGS